MRFDPGCKCCNHAAKVRCDPTDTGSRTPTPRPTARPALTQRPQIPQIPQRPTARPAPTRRPQRPIQTPDDNNNSPCHMLRPGTTLPNPSDATCNSFLVCSESGEPTVNNCPSTLSYNPACKCCDYPRNTVCQGIPTPGPTKRPVSGGGNIFAELSVYLMTAECTNLTSLHVLRNFQNSYLAPLRHPTHHKTNNHQTK